MRLRLAFAREKNLSSCVMKQSLLALTASPGSSTQQRNCKPGVKPSTYEPISSVWERSDSELLEAMFGFYASIDPEPILDATYNAGRFWKDSRRKVVSMDIDPQYKTMIVGDNRETGGV